MEAGTCKKELVIEIPVEEVRKETETVTANYARRAIIPGFRRGHAPASIVRRHFREDIRNEIVQSLVPKFFQNVVRDRKLSVVGRPRFEDLRFEDDQPLTCKATFEVVPEFNLGEYKGLEVEEELPTVTDADLEQALERLRERAATFELTDGRPAEDGDYLSVNYRGINLNNSEAPPVEANDVVVHLGQKGTVAGFSENLRGATAGEVREFEVTYPEDYPQKGLAGKAYRYRVEVLSIKKKVVPPLDDELAKSVSEFSTLQELRNKLREELLEQRKRKVEAEAKQKLAEALLKNQEFPVPEVLVEQQLDRKLERMLSQLIVQGIDPRNTEVDWRKIREEGRVDAEKEVRTALILERIAEAEKIEVSEDEVDEIIRELARERHETPAAVKTRLTEEGEIARLKSSRRNQKALDFVYRNAIITRKSDGGTERVKG